MFNKAKRVKEGELYYYIGVVTAYDPEKGIDGHEFRVTPKNDNMIDTDELNFMTGNYHNTIEQAQAFLDLRKHETAMEDEYGEIYSKDKIFRYIPTYEGKPREWKNMHWQLIGKEYIGYDTIDFCLMHEFSKSEEREKRRKLFEKAIEVFNK